MADNIQVVVRVRPLLERELAAGGQLNWKCHGNTIQCTAASGKNHSYTFDAVFAPENTTTDVYQNMEPIIQSVMDGVNGTIFAYGQTSSGKTYTMMGSNREQGIINMVCNQIYEAIENQIDREFLMRVSYMELYNENVVDLLRDSGSHLEVREDTEGRVFVDKLSEEICCSTDQILEYVSRGEARRHFAATNMNDRSSRSHTILKIVIESRLMDDVDSDCVKFSVLNLVDLAGSEKAKQTGASGQRLAEGGYINKSLFTLAKVISQLSETGSGSRFVNYRDSKLTRILQNSLGGNSKTSIICNCTPASIEETLSTLRFATSAKKITNKPVVNEILSNEAMIVRYKREIDKLQDELKKMKLSELGNVQTENQELQQRLEQEARLRAEQEDKIRKMEAFICVSSTNRPDAVTPTAMKMKAKRRETWCPGRRVNAKGRALHTLPVIPDLSGLDSPTARSLDLAAGSRRSHPREVRFSSPPLASGDTPDQQPQHLQLQLTEDRLHTLEDRLATTERQLQSTEIKLHAVKGNLETSEGRRLTSEQRLSGAEDRLRTTEEELMLANTELQDKHCQLRTLESQLESVQGQLESLQGQVTSQQAEIEKLRRERDDMKSECTRLRDDFDERLFIEIEQQLKDESMALKSESDSSVSSSRGGAADVTSPPRAAAPRLASPRQALRVTPSRDSAAAAVDELRVLRETLARDRADAESCMLDLHRELARYKDQNKCLHAEMEVLSKSAKQLENERADFDFRLELEQDKFSRREAELKEQLESVYKQLEGGRKSAPVATQHDVNQKTSYVTSQAQTVQAETDDKYCNTSFVADVVSDVTSSADVSVENREQVLALEERVQSLTTELEAKVAELKQLELSHKEELSSLSATHCLAIDELKQQVESLQSASLPARTSRQSLGNVTTYDITMMDVTMAAASPGTGDLTSQPLSLADELAACSTGANESRLDMTLIDDVSDLTVGLTGMFPRQSLSARTSSLVAPAASRATPPLEQSALVELKRDFELETAQLKQNFELETAQLKQNFELETAQLKRNLEEEIANLQQKIESLQEENARLQESVRSREALEVEIQQLKQTLAAQELSETPNSNDEDIHRLKADVDSLQEQLADADTVLTHKECELADMQERLASKQAEIERLADTQELLASKEAEIERLSCAETELKCVSEQLVCQNEELAVLQERIDSKALEIADLQGCIKQKDAELTALQERLASKDAELTGIQERMLCKNTELANLHEHLTHKDAEYTVIHERLTSAELELAEIQERERKLKIQHDDKVVELESEIEALLGARTEMTSSDEQLRAENSTLQKQLDAQIAKKAGFAAKVEELQKVIDSSHEKIAHLQSVIDSSANDKEAEFVSEIARLEDTVTALESELSAAQIKITEHEATIAKGTTLYKNVKADYEEVLAQCDELTELNEQLHQQKTEQQREAEELTQRHQAELDQLHDEHIKLVEDMNAKLAAMSDDLVKSNQEVETLQQSLQNQEKLHCDSQATLTQLQEDNIELQKRAKELQEETEKLRVQLADLQTDLEDRRTAAAEEEAFLKKCCDDADRELEEMTSQCHAVKNDLQSAKRTLTDVQEQKSSLEQQLTKRSAEVSRLQTELAVMTSSAGARQQPTTSTANDSELQAMKEEVATLREELEHERERAAEEETHLKKCCDDADRELDEMTSLKYGVEQELKRSKNMEAKLQAEASRVQKLVVEKDEEIGKLRASLNSAADPDKLRQLTQEVRQRKERIAVLENELRKLSKAQAHETIVTPKSATDSSCRINGSGGVNAEILRYRLEVTQRQHEEEVSRFRGQIEAHKKTEVVLKTEIKQLRLDVKENADQLSKYRDMYNKLLTSDDRHHLRDIANSPAPSLRTPRRTPLRNRGKENVQYKGRLDLNYSPKFSHTIVEEEFMDGSPPDPGVQCPTQ